MTDHLARPERRRFPRVPAEAAGLSARVRVRPGGDADVLDASTHAVALAMPYGRLRVGEAVTIRSQGASGRGVAARVLGNRVHSLSSHVVRYRVVLAIDSAHDVARALPTQREQRLPHESPSGNV